MSSVKQGIVIPVYNHGLEVGAVVEKLLPLGLPIIMVDDGSNAETKSCLEKIGASVPLVVLVTLKKNSGKGGAVLAGLKKAAELGLSHVLQVDADGQHDLNRARFFLEESVAHPQAAICSWPEYDDSVPASRKNGRKVANTWAKIVTLSSDIVDSMVGFRVYPVKSILSVCKYVYIDPRMGFDIEVLVRLVWKNVQLIFYPIKVIYPEDGVSHFRPVRDNIRISWSYTRLCCGMLLRLPILLIRKMKKAHRER